MILHRIWGQQPLAYKSWAIQKDPSEIEQELWRVRGVDVLDIPLEDYVTELESRAADGNGRVVTASATEPPRPSATTRTSA